MSWILGKVIPAPPPTSPMPAAPYDPLRDVFKLGPAPKPRVWTPPTPESFPCGWDERDAKV